MARDLTVNILAPSDKFEAGTKRMEASARALHASELRLIAAEERLEKLRAAGKASAGQLASAQASVIGAQDKVAAAHGRTATATEQAGRRSSKSFAGISASATAMSGAVGLAAGVAGGAMVAMARDSVRAASELNEQIAATRTVFKDASGEVLTFADDVAGSLGISERAALQAANGFGDLFTKLGFTSTAAATFSEDLVRISADFASFKDLNPEDVLEKLRSGLAGESEPLRSLGVFLTEAKVQAEGLRLGLANTSGAMDDGAKVAARYSLIIQGMGEAQGDVARTADSYANTQRRASAATEDLKAAIGQQLLPVMTDGAYVFAEFAKALGGVADGGRDGAEGLDVLERSLGRTEEHAVYGKSGFELLADAVRKLKGDSDDTAESTDELADSQAALSDKQSRLRQNTQDTTEALKEQADALDRLLQATVSQFDSELAYQNALLGVADDLEDYNEALAANSDGKADNDVSARELAKQELGLKDALLAAAGAAVKQAEDNAAAAGRTLTESQKYDLFRQALEDLKEEFPELGAEIDGYVARLKEVPATVDTSVRVLGVADAEAALMRVEKAIRGVTNIGGVQVRIPPIRVSDPMGDGPGRGGPALARVRASLPPGLSITSTYRSPAANARAGGSPGSYHLDRGNPAVDIAGPTAMLDAYHQTLRNMGGWRELLWRKPGHYDHIHAAAAGGLVRGPFTPTSTEV